MERGLCDGFIVIQNFYLIFINKYVFVLKYYELCIDVCIYVYIYIPMPVYILVVAYCLKSLRLRCSDTHLCCRTHRCFRLHASDYRTRSTTNMFPFAMVFDPRLLVSFRLTRGGVKCGTKYTVTVIGGCDIRNI